MVSDAHESLVAMLSAARVTPEAPIEQTRAGWDLMEGVLPHAADVDIEDATQPGLTGRWFTPPHASEIIVLHLHGGGYVIGSSRSHTPFASHLAATLGARVLLLDYPLAPEHPAPAAIDQTVAAYESMLDAGADPRHIVVSGDSAGGGLAVAAMVRLRDTSRPLPAAAALISPWTDATLDFESMRTKVDEDIILSPELMTFWRRSYAGELPFDDPRLSPGRGRLEGLPPIHVQVGTRELLLDDARQFADNASRAGVDVTLEVCDDVIHIWPVLGAGLVPEAQDALDRIRAFLVVQDVLTK